MRGFAHLAHIALKRLTGEGIDREAGFLPAADAAHVGLVDAGVHLHVGQVLGNHKHLGGLQAGGHGLALLHRAFDDDAAHRRHDARAPQIHLGLRHQCAALRHGGLRGFDLRLGHAHLGLCAFQRLFGGGHGGPGAVGLALGDEALVNQAQVAFVDAAGLGQVGLRTRHRGPCHGGVGLGRQHVGLCRVQVGLGRAHAVFVGSGVDLGDELPGFDLAVEVGKQLFDLPRNLRTDRHLGHWVHVARRRHGGHQRTALQLARAVSHFAPGTAGVPPPGTATCQQGQRHGTGHPTAFFHGANCRQGGMTSVFDRALPPVKLCKAHPTVHSLVSVSATGPFASQNRTPNDRDHRLDPDQTGRTAPNIHHTRPKVSGTVPENTYNEL